MEVHYQTRDTHILILPKTKHRYQTKLWIDSCWKPKHQGHDKKVSKRGKFALTKEEEGQEVGVRIENSS